MDSKLLLDVIVSAGILLFIIGPRFNTWTKDSQTLFVGKPSEYIDRYRYVGYYSIYLLTHLVLVFAFYNFPELMPLVSEQSATSGFYATFTEVFGENSFSVSFLILSTLLANGKISSYDERWRNYLHKLARIPKDVEEFKSAIIQGEAYSPGEKYIAIAKQELEREADVSPRGEALKNYWIPFLDRWREEKEQRTINWYYIKCLCLMLVVRDVCERYDDSGLQRKDDRIQDLGKLIPYLVDESADVSEHQKELEALSNYFTECISKYLVQKYRSKHAQHNAFNNLGFDIEFHDSTELKIGEALGYCVIGIMLISGISTGMLVSVIDRTAQFQSWTLGGIFALSISILVGVLVQKINAARQLEATVPVYGVALIIATLSALMYLQFANGPNSSLGRIILSLSFSTLSVVVIRSLEEVNYEIKDLRDITLTHAIGLGIAMGLLQMGISMAYAYDRGGVGMELFSYEFLARNEFVLMKVGMVGAFKGFCLGGMVTYLIQDLLRRQQLATLRSYPRVKFRKIVNFEQNGKVSRVNTRDISKTGMLVTCNAKLQPGEVVEMSAPFMGKITGVISWTKKRLLGKQLVGIEFQSGETQLQNYIRQRYGEFYA